MLVTYLWENISTMEPVLHLYKNGVALLVPKIFFQLISNYATLHWSCCSVFISTSPEENALGDLECTVIAESEVEFFSGKTKTPLSYWEAALFMFKTNIQILKAAIVRLKDLFTNWYTPLPLDQLVENQSSPETGFSPLTISAFHWGFSLSFSVTCTHRHTRTRLHLWISV